MANTFISLDDTPVEYTGLAGRFLRVNNAESGIETTNIALNTISDVETAGAYAPSVGQTLVYSASGKWRPSTLDVYSAGNGLNKTNLTLNVFATAGGGLTSNVDGVQITPISNVAGTYGNSVTVPVITVNDRGQVTSVEQVTANAQVAQELAADYVSTVEGTIGQISVTGGTGNNSTATVNLVATGVTAGTYGNTNQIPQITVDSYGRIQNVDLVDVVAGNVDSGNGNIDLSTLTSTAYRDIVITGTSTPQTALAADEPHDTLTLDAGGGITITTTASSDTITFGANTTEIAASINISDLQGIDATGIADGQAIIWDSANSEFVPGNVVVDLPDTGVTAGTYGNATSYPSITVDSKGRVTNISNVAFTGGGTDGNADQVLSWNSGSLTLTISGGNSVDLTSIVSTTLADINVASASASAGGSLSYDNQGGFTFRPANLAPYATLAYVDSEIANVAVTGGYGNSNVELYLTDNGYVTDTFVSNAISNATANLASTSYVDAAVANVSVDLTGYATESYVDAAVANVPTNYQTLSFNANSNVLTISDSNSTVDFTDAFADLITSNPVTSGVSVERFRLNYAADGTLSGVAQVSSGIDNVSIESSTGGEVTVEFDVTQYNFPPSGVLMYGYDYTNNKYWMVPLETSMGLREVPAGGTSGSPTLFNGNSAVEVRLRLRETETGAVRGGFGTTTHAWIVFSMFA